MITPWSLPLQVVLLFFAGWVNRQQQDVIEYLLAQQRVTRELLDKELGGRRLRLSDEQRRRLAVAGRNLGRQALAKVCCLVTPETILRWYRQLIARKYDGSARRRRGPGRPRTREEIARLTVRLARENVTWGYTRIRDALANLQIHISRSTVGRILKRNGVLPAPERSRRMPWRTFLRAHWEAVAAADFFTVEVLTWRGLVRYTVFFVIRLETRKVEIAGLSSEPHGAWVKQLVRNLTDAFDGFLLGVRYLILDRDPLYTAEVRGLLEASGVKVRRLPPRSPNLNAYAERFIGSLRREALGRLVPLGEAHLRRILRAYVLHYNHERPHQGLDSQLIEPDETAGRGEGRIVCRERLGGLLRYYHRAAA